MGRVSGGYGSCAPGLRGLTLLLVLVSALSGCTSMQALDRESAARSIDAGDTVFVSTQNGRELELAFDAWSSDGLTGTDDAGILQKIDNEDIENVRVKKFSVWKNVALGAAILGVAAALAVDDTVDAIEGVFEDLTDGE